MELTGQIFGWSAALLTFLSYQCKEHKKLVIVQTLSSVSICVSYLSVGAYSGMLLNAICLLRNFIICKKNVKIFSHPCVPYVLALIMGAAGTLSAQGGISFLVIVALAVNTIFLYFPNVQNLRKSILVTSTMVLVYNAYYFVWGGVANELIAIASAAIGIYRYRKIAK